MLETFKELNKASPETNTITAQSDRRLFIHILEGIISRLATSEKKNSSFKLDGLNLTLSKTLKRGQVWFLIALIPDLCPLSYFL